VIFSEFKNRSPVHPAGRSSGGIFALETTEGCEIYSSVSRNILHKIRRARLHTSALSPSLPNQLVCPPHQKERLREGGRKEGDKKRLSKQQADKKLGLQYLHRQEALRIAFPK
jgi:hypothetical protein